MPRTAWSQRLAAVSQDEGSAGFCLGVELEVGLELVGAAQEGWRTREVTLLRQSFAHIHETVMDGQILAGLLIRLIG